VDPAKTKAIDIVEATRQGISIVGSAWCRATYRSFSSRPRRNRHNQQRRMKSWKR
jgi:hypothetical protein